MSDGERRIPVIIYRAPDDAFASVGARITVDEKEVGCAGRDFTVALAPGRHALIAETEPTGELDGAALRLSGNEVRVEVPLRAVEVAEGRIRVIFDAVKRVFAP